MSAKAPLPMWVAVPPSLLALNEAAPLQIRDPYGAVLVEAGEHIASVALLQKIQSIGLCQIEDLGRLALTETVAVSPVRNRVTLAEFPLPSGTLAFVHPQDDEDSQPAQVLGCIQGEELLLRPTPGTILESMRLKLAKASDVEVRIAVGQDVLRFSCSVRMQHQLPYWFMHLGWPADVSLQQDRLCPRLPVHQPVLIDRSNDVRRSALLLNLSEQGALVQYHTKLGKPGDELRLHFVLPTDQGHASFTLDGVIRNRHAGLHAEDEVLHGIEFLHITANEMQSIRRHVQRMLVT
ncbi:PilZ domain-containing protein [Chitinilyticum piscinae]|uniref:PilZ domain-containing protein n=1 Tax=Chitinilyticum piscinae TaxID=2866724 RepID=A0A8J7FJQ1_9NEIS|nr:PilZ domain-containing protein [Chitinilyticum piscinae]MBE9610630.1 PilZ domain-containing protein [Chitinilyticum piscinae]